MRRFFPLLFGVAVAIISMPSVASADLLYVTNFTGNTISRVDSSGNVTTPITGVVRPIGIAFGPNGDIYTAAGGAGSPGISEYTPSGTFVGSFNGGQLTNPTGLAFDALGNLFAANAIPDKIVQFVPGGANFVVANTFGNSTQLNTPVGVAIDPGSGNVYVANSGGVGAAADTVAIFSPLGIYLGSINENSTNGGQETAPTGLAFDRFGHLYISNFGPDTISEINVPTLGQLNGSTFNPTLVKTLVLPTNAGPAGLAFDSQGNLFVAGEFSGNSIYEFASTGPGSVSNTATTFATGNGLSNPYFLAFAPTAVPEPSSVILVGLGSAGLFGFNVLRRRSGAKSAA